MSKHVALNDVHLVVLTVCLHNKYHFWVCGCELIRSQCFEYYYVNEFHFHNFIAVSIISTHFTAHPMFTITAAICEERNRVFRLVNYKNTQGLSGEIFGWIPAMRVQWTPQCICNSFDTPVMLVALMHSYVSGSDSCERLQAASWYMFAETERGDMLSASKLDSHLLYGTFKQECTAHARLWAGNPSWIVCFWEFLYEG